MRELSWILWPTKACTQPRKALRSFSVRSRKSSQGAVDLLPVTPQIQGLVESQMCRDNETTAVQLHEPLCRHGRNISPSTILRSRLSLGWTFRGSAYCQMIYQENKVNLSVWPSLGYICTRRRVVSRTWCGPIKRLYNSRRTVSSAVGNGPGISPSKCQTSDVT